MKKLCECGCGKPSPICFYSWPARGYVKGQPLRFIPYHQARMARAARKTHGMSRSPEYDAYCSARQRCENPNMPQWERYGGRGIKFLFASFEEFFAELGPRPSSHHSLDRFPNNDGHYEVGNVRWATRSQQMTNCRFRQGLWERVFSIGTVAPIGTEADTQLVYKE